MCSTTTKSRLPTRSQRLGSGPRPGSRISRARRTPTLFHPRSDRTVSFRLDFLEPNHIEGEVPFRHELSRLKHLTVRVAPYPVNRKALPAPGTILGKPLIITK